MSTTVRRLVEKAAHFEGSQTRVAEQLGVSLQRLGDWQRGYRPMPDEQVIALAQLASQDPKHALGEYRWERYQSTKKGNRAAAVALAFAVGALSHGSDSGARTKLASPEAVVHYVNWMRRWLFGSAGRARTGQSSLTLASPTSSQRRRLKLRSAAGF